MTARGFYLSSPNPINRSPHPLEKNDYARTLFPRRHESTKNRQATRSVGACSLSSSIYLKTYKSHINRLFVSRCRCIGCRSVGRLIERTTGSQMTTLVKPFVHGTNIPVEATVGTAFEPLYLLFEILYVLVF